MSIDENQIKILINKIKNLTPKEKTHILSILKKYSIEFTKNSNGYFFNLNKIEPEVMEKLTRCVDLIEKNRNLIVLLDKKREEQLEYYRTLIETKLNKTIEMKRAEYIKQFVIETDYCDFKQFIRKKPRFNKIPQNVDCDVLMKEYTAVKYHKDSIYYKILQKIARSQRQTKARDITEDGAAYDENENETFGDTLGEIETGEDYFENTEFDIETEIEIETENLGENELDLEAEAEAEVEINGVENDLENNNEENEEDDIDIQEDLETVNEDTLDYYKKLLNSKLGMVFDYNKDVKMQRESYIY